MCIFDIGANKGQSIERFLNIFPNATIHAFEPIEEEYLGLVKKYKKNKKILINNLAISYKKGTANFYSIDQGSEISSFIKIKKNTNWFKERSNFYKMNPDIYKTVVKKVKTIQLDEYINNKKISNIDILKIDTQGTEDKVLQGCKKNIKKKIINFIEVEICFSDIYEKTLSFFSIESVLSNNYRLFGLNNHGNLYQNLFILDALYKLKK